MNHKTILLLLLFSAKVSLSAAQSAPPFWKDIVAFHKLDSASFPPKGAILFVGSSSFEKWKDVGSYFPAYTIINRGFGGSTLKDVIRYSYDIVLPYKPKQIVIYCGENDLAYVDTLSASEVVLRFKTLFRILRQNLPKTRIDFVSIKPSPSRAKIMAKCMEANKDIKAFLKQEKKADFIDVFVAMLDANGNPKEELFLPDRLHMKPEGYKLWQKIIQPYLLK